MDAMDAMDEWEDDVRAMSPPPFETDTLRFLINGGSEPTHVLPSTTTVAQAPTAPVPVLGTLDLSSLSRFNFPTGGGAHPSALDPPPKRQCPSTLPPTLPPLPTLPSVTPLPAARPLSPPSPPNAVRAMPGLRHAGLLREYGGIRRYMQMQRGERPWPSQADA